MTKSIKAQKLFLRLLANQNNKRSGNRVGFMRKYNTWNKKFPSSHKVKVEIINAVTGEKTTAYAAEESKRALKKWLRIRNVRAHFDNMLLKPKASWFNFTSEEFKNFPIIVKVTDTQFPYTISHIGERITVKNKTTCSIYLQTLDNIDYLNLISDKKKLMKKWIEENPIKPKRKAKRKKRMDFDFDE